MMVSATRKVQAYAMAIATQLAAEGTVGFGGLQAQLGLAAGMAPSIAISSFKSWAQEPSTL